MNLSGLDKPMLTQNFPKFSAVTAIDSSGIDAIYELRKTLLNRSVQVRQHDKDPNFRFTFLLKIMTLCCFVVTIFSSWCW